jgi:hypothetical protein
MATAHLKKRVVQLEMNKKYCLGLSFIEDKTSIVFKLDGTCLIDLSEITAGLTCLPQRGCLRLFNNRT